MSTLKPAIIAAELYLPRTAVHMSTLEKLAGEPEGRYSVGLQQNEMTVVSGFEDATSMALTATVRLIQRMKVDKRLIGRLDVGSESNTDSSKSIKSTVAGILGIHWAEGTDHVNACYGGTDALFSSLDWLSSLPPSLKEKAYAIVVATDIAEYDTPSALASGGGGAVALLLKNSTEGLYIKEGIRGTITENVFDFCKPPGTMYPSVKGKYSIDCYIAAFEEAYWRYIEMMRLNEKGIDLDLSSFSGIAFHSPFTKLAMRSIAFLNELQKMKSRKEKDPESFPSPSIEYGNLAGIISNDKTLKEQVDRLGKSLNLNMFTGNCYTASWLVSLISCFQDNKIDHGKILVFSYGSGCIASMFILEIGSVIDFHSNIVISNTDERPKSNRRLLSQEEYEKLKAFRVDCKQLQFNREEFDPKDVLKTHSKEDLSVWMKEYIEDDIYILKKCTKDGERMYEKISMSHK